MYAYEYTDTFGGEANYCWVRRGIVDAKTDAQAVRMAKAALGLNGVRCKRDDIGETIVLRPDGCCTVLFIDWKEI